MFNKIPLKKDHFYIAAGLLVCLIVYQLSINKTLAAWQIHHALEQQISEATDLSYTPGYFEQEDQRLTKILLDLRVDSGAYRSQTVSRIATLADSSGVKLTTVPTDMPGSRDSLFQAHQLVFTGSYPGLMRLLFTLEHTPHIGFLRSVNLQSHQSNAGDGPGIALNLSVVFTTERHYY